MSLVQLPSSFAMGKKGVLGVWEENSESCRSQGDHRGFLNLGHLGSDQTRQNWAPASSEQHSQGKAQLTAVLTQTPGPQTFSHDCWIGTFFFFFGPRHSSRRNHSISASISISLDSDEVQTATSSDEWLLEAQWILGGMLAQLTARTWKGDICPSTGKTTNRLPFRFYPQYHCWACGKRGSY